MAIRWSRSSIPLCWFDRHAPVRTAAQWDGRTYHGTCRFCGASISRRERGDWRRDTPRPA